MQDADFVNLFPALPVCSAKPPPRQRKPELRGPERHAQLSKFDRTQRQARGRDEA